jgi:hypothetical protein
VRFDDLSTESDQARSIEAAAIEQCFDQSLFSIFEAGYGDASFGCMERFTHTRVNPLYSGRT